VTVARPDCAHAVVLDPASRHTPTASHDTALLKNPLIGPPLVTKKIVQRTEDAGEVQA
jgi:hypothetical protein